MEGLYYMAPICAGWMFGLAAVLEVPRVSDLGDLSAVSRLCLGCLSAASRLPLGCLSAAFRLCLLFSLEVPRALEKNVLSPLAPKAGQL